jgi:hypothetical protein
MNKSVVVFFEGAENLPGKDDGVIFFFYMVKKAVKLRSSS